MSSTNFKVIVVGGGPVGLTAANALQRAGIDFVLLERRPDVVIDAGSNLVLSPMGLRALEQLGLHDQIEAVTSELAITKRFDHTSRDIGESRIFVHIKAAYGTAPRCISRHDLTKVLYDGLSEESHKNIYGNKNVTAITSTPKGVMVSCADGTSYAGNIVVGADGAHSRVRGLMRSMAVAANATNINAEQPFWTTYRCLWVRFPVMGGLQEGDSAETHGEKAATQLFAGSDSAVLGLYERMDAPTQERQRYTVDDQLAIIERWGHLPLTSTLTLRDIYENKMEAGLVSLEEGLVEHWSHDGRVVLVGDAAHKFTPSTGAGCNNGIIDVAALTNALQPVLNSTASPSPPQLDAAFTAYQTARYDVVKKAGDGSSNATSSATWQTGVHKFIDRQIMSRSFVQKTLIRLAAREMDTVPSFSFAKTTAAPMIKA